MTDKDANVPTLVLMAMETHNELRRRHGAPDLKLDPGLCLKAQGLAQSLADTGDTGKGPEGVGVNFFRSSRSSLDDPTQVVRTAATQWYSQQTGYNWATPLSSSFGETKFFTQLIWAKSTQFGVGVAIGGDKNFISVVALYSPAAGDDGMVRTEESLRENVRPALH